MAEDKLTEEIKDTIGGQFYGWYIFVHYHGHYTVYMVYTECEKGHPYLVEEVSTVSVAILGLYVCVPVCLLPCCLPQCPTRQLQ